MSTLSTCPCCGIQLGISRMRAHLVLCGESQNKTRGKNRSDAVGAARSSKSFPRETPLAKNSLRAEKSTPSRSPGFADPPAVFRVDLRSKAEGGSGVRATPLHLERAGRPNSCRRPFASPSPRGAKNGLPAKKGSIADAASSRSGGRANSNADGGACGDELTDVEGSGDVTFSVDSRLLERLAWLEAANEELRAALAREQEKREKSTLVFEGSLALMRGELVTLRTLIDDATTTAKGAADGVACSKELLKRFATQEEFDHLRKSVDTLLLHQYVSHDPAGGCVASLANKSADSYLSASQGASAGNALIRGVVDEGKRFSTGKPFLDKDTGEMIAKVLYLQPAAMIHTVNKMPVIKTLGVSFERN